MLGDVEELAAEAQLILFGSLASGAQPHGDSDPRRGSTGLVRSHAPRLLTFQPGRRSSSSVR